MQTRRSTSWPSHNQWRFVLPEMAATHFHSGGRGTNVCGYSWIAGAHLAGAHRKRDGLAAITCLRTTAAYDATFWLRR